MQDLRLEGIPNPIKDQVAVRQDPLVGERTPGGLYVPDCARRTLQTDYATVLKVGPGDVLPGGERRVMDVKAGDRVLFQRTPDTALIPDGREGGRPEWKDVLMLPYEAIVSVLEDEGAPGVEQG